MLDYIAYLTVRLLNKIFHIIPISVSLRFGRSLGDLAFFVNKKRRLIAYANLKAAFCAEKPPSELRALTKAVYRNMLQTFMEILSLTKVDKSYIDRYVEVVNLARIQDAAKSGRGTVLLTAHFGDWELSNLTSAMFGFPILVLVREQKMKRLNELLNRLRESKGCKVVRKGISTKNILRALYDKNMVGILADQDAGRTGVFVDFFGRPTSSHAGTMEMAKRTDSIILPNFIVRTKGPYHKLFLEEYIELGDSKDDIKESLQKYAKLLESYVRRYPDQWLWLHKRWKSTPTRTVLVLSDGKAGHLNQSLAVARQIQRARATQGYTMDDTKVKVVGVKYKNGLSRAVLGICSAFATWRCHGCMRCMRASLDKSSYDELMRTYAEFVVSCGSSLAPVNIFMSKENNAKNIVVMKPDFALSKFGLAIVPKHDAPAKRENVVATLTAPNLMDEDTLKRDGERLRQKFNIDGRDNIGIFIGGDNPEFSITKDIIEKVLAGALGFAGTKDNGMLITTSRRTPADVERFLRERMANDRRCKLLVIANEKNVDGAVSGMLDSSRVAIVSGESVSMVSEAVSAGKKTIVFEARKKSENRTKHEKALAALADEGYIRVAKPEGISEAIAEEWDSPQPAKRINDSEKIFEAVRRLI